MGVDDRAGKVEEDGFDDVTARQHHPCARR